ncbi:hypothetical protein EI71_00448 [Anaeroplasma bactoclasticum]|jgi:hypothetical protein|uniref:Lipoprotein n=1 Tax=Anaeroplasma bactoclasticum TaxID=2088 RepID=A0A397S009_9MOLU|nr:hypothetical protein [Anaeroplasma bactoclasticum]RIA78136.1 hypothetical protein EI71_00448 [Anaeroplasma bactoclasticum]
MKKVICMISLLFLTILSGCGNDTPQRAYEIGKVESFDKTLILIECDTENELFSIDVKNLKYEAVFDFRLTIDFKQIDNLQFYNVTKGEAISIAENYTMKEDSTFNVSYKDISIDYKNEILKGNFQIDFYGSLWVIIK